MSVFVYPIVPDAASNESRNVACQMGNAYPGKNKKPQVIGDEVEILFPGQHIPVNAEFLGEFRPMPMGVLVHEALDTPDIRGCDAASTYCHGCFHDKEYSK